MACVTLKRPLALDTLMSPGGEPRDTSAPGPSSLHQAHPHPPIAKRRRCTNLTFVPAPPSSSSCYGAGANASAVSCMRKVAERFPRLSGDALRQRLKQEVRRLRRARILPSAHAGCSTTPVPMLSVPESSGTLVSTNAGCSSGSDSEDAPSPVRPSSRMVMSPARSQVSDPQELPGSSSPSRNNMSAPLFSFHQIGLICARLLAEREETLQTQYETVLSDKLAEQYEAFLRFSHEQLYRQHQDMPMSYVS